MILSQDLDYLFGEGHRRYVVPFCREINPVPNDEKLKDSDNYVDENHYFESIEDAEAKYNEVLGKDETYCASLAVVVDDSDGDPFSNRGYIALLEAVSDVTNIACGRDFYSGDSRQDTQLFIEWAIEFEKLHLGVSWGEDEKLPSGKPLPYGIDYMEAIELFTSEKIWLLRKEDQD